MAHFSGQGDFSLILDMFMSELRGCVHVLALFQDEAGAKFSSLVMFKEGKGTK